MSGPVVQRFGDEVFVSWAGLLTVQFAHFTERFGLLYAQVTTTGAELEELPAWGTIALTSSEGRSKMAKRLPPALATLFEQACREAIRAWHQPPKWQALVPKRRPESSLAWIWQRWIPAGETTVLYGDGDSGKSWLALTLAVCTLTGMPLAGTWPVAQLESVLYVDYESTAETHAHRLSLLCDALDTPSPSGLYYLRASAPVHELGALLRAQQQRTRAGLLILDSLGAASAGEPESAQASFLALNTLASLGPACSRLVLAHISHGEQRHEGHRKAYGSVYNRNLPRANVEIRRNPLDTQALTVALRVDKNNDLERPLPEPVSLTMARDEVGALRWTRAILPRPPRATRHAILALLPRAADDAISSATLSDRLDVDERTIEKALERMARDELVKRVALGRRGKGVKTTWIRIDRKCDKSEDDSATPF